MSVVAPISASTEPELQSAFVAARAMCRRESLDLYLACRVLPRAKADAACAVLALFGMIREGVGAGDVDVTTAAAMREHPVVASPALHADGAGCCGGDASPEGRVAMIRDRLREIYAGTIELPAVAGRSPGQHVMAAMGQVVARYEIPPSYFIDYAEGCCADLATQRYATWRSLERHLDRSVGAVAQAVTCVLGATHSDAPVHARQLGRALRLTSILCNARDDFVKRGRIYLPLEDLAKFRYSERDLAAGVVDDRFRELARFEIDRARALYRDAAAGLPWLAGDGSRLMGASVIAVHSALLSRIEGAGYDVFTRGITLTAPQKLRRMPLAWRLASRETGDGAATRRI